ncbi:MAG: hypothetical protein EXR21_10210 [Flavobacteriaceae bacterium]|nr:hypothetical protein [Flavobacteriaceae bacterium]
MKNKSIYIVAICASVLGIFSACNREKTKVINRIVDVNLYMNEIYNLNLNQYESDEAALISKQANHFAKSEVVKQAQIRPANAPKAGYSYTYTPALNYVGEDEVILTGEGEEVQVRKCGNMTEEERKELEEEKDDDDIILNTTIRFHIVNNPDKN